MAKTLVSVVAPVYNVEQYLDRCIHSIVNQTYHNLEIILVDDGSPDNCPRMCDDWAKKDSRVKVIHQENQGLGMARNTGICHARGAYICFVDGDDYVALDTIELACGLAQKECADLVVFGMQSVDAGGNTVGADVLQLPRSVYTGREVQEHLLPDLIGPNPRTGVSANIPLSACCVLLSGELIKRANWSFVSEREIISEDIYSIIALFASVRKAAVLQRALYYYCENNTSLSRSYRSDRYEQNRHFYIKCLELCAACNYCEEVVHRCAEPFFRNTIAAMKQEAAYHDRRTAMVRLRAIMDDELLQKVLREKRRDKTNLKRRILFQAIRWKRYSLCYAMLAAQNAADKSVRKSRR